MWSPRIKSQATCVCVVLAVASVGCREDRLLTDPREPEAIGQRPNHVLLTLGGVVQVTTGEHHSCALKSDGKVACWGDNTFGQSAPPGSSFSQISAGGSKTCGLRTDGALACWGSNGFAGPPTPPAGTYVQVSSGANHACALTGDGTAVCWGANYAGQSSPPPHAFSQVAAGYAHTCGLLPVGIVECWGDIASPPGDTFTQISSGANFACGIKTDVTIGCWGVGYNGQSTPPPGQFTQVSAGLNYACAAGIDGLVACWGYNGFGQSTPPSDSFNQVSSGWNHTCGLGADGQVRCWGYDGSGAATPPTATFSQVSAGRDFTCGVVETGGALACWGQSSFGQATPPGGSFLEVSSGISHSCGLHSDGTVACWGFNSDGQATPPAGAFSQVSVGGGHSCGLKTDNTVECWGNNYWGQATPPFGTFSQVSAGGSHTCGLETDGTIVCWGNDFDGQSTVPTGPFSQVSAGSSHTCGLRTDGTVTCWGYNLDGRASAPTGTFSQISAGGVTCGVRTDGALACWGFNGFRQASPPIGTFHKLTVGDNHSCALEPDESVACWGHTSIAQGPNHAPIAGAGGPYGVTPEGDFVSFDGSSSSDPEGDALSYLWDFGDGEPNGTGINPTHGYVDNGTYVVTLTVSDGSLNDVMTTTVSVGNAAPVVNAGPDGTTSRNQTYTLSASFNDAGLVDAPWQTTIDWGDGSPPTSGSSGAQGAIGGSHVYTTAGSRVITVSVTDKDGGTGSDAANVTVSANRAPIAFVNGPYSGNEAAQISFTAAGSSDPDGNPITYAWNFGDGGTGTGQKPKHIYADNGAYTVTVTVSDGSLTNAASAPVTVANVAPTATFGHSGAVPEGSPFTLTLTNPNDVSAPDQTAGFQYSFDCGTGYGAFSAATSATCPTVDNGARTVRGRIRDKDGGTKVYSASQLVNNKLPVVSISAGGPTTILKGQSFTLNSLFTDAGVQDNPWTETITWGNGSQTLTANSQGAQPPRTRVYNTRGTFTIKMTVKDKNGGIGTSNTLTLVVQ